MSRRMERQATASRDVRRQKGTTLMTAKINSPSQLRALCDQRAHEKFFGEVRLVFQNGRFSRMVVEQSIQITPHETAPNDPRSNFRKF